MKTICNIFVLVLFILPLTTFSQSIFVDIATAQKKIDAVQIKGKGAFKVIDEKAVKLENGDIITTSLCFCDSMPGATNTPYTYFPRKYGLTTNTGKKLDPLYDNLVYWEKDQYLVKYRESGPPNSYEEENWYALIDKNFKVLQVYLEEGIAYSPFYRVKKNGKYGAIDGSLDERLPFVYDSLSELSARDEVQVLVKERSFYSYAAKGKNKWGLITTDNDTIVPFHYDFLGNSAGGYMVAKNKGKWGVISQMDTIAVPFEYDSIITGSLYLLKGKKWASLPSDLNYKKAIHQYDELAFNPGGGRSLARIGTKWYFLSDAKIKETDVSFEGYHFDPDSGPFIFVKKADMYAIYDTYKGFKTEFIYSKIIDVLYEREWEDYTNYPVYRFKVIEDGKEVEFTIRN